MNNIKQWIEFCMRLEWLLKFCNILSVWNRDVGQRMNDRNCVARASWHFIEAHISADILRLKTIHASITNIQMPSSTGYYWRKDSVTNLMFTVCLCIALSYACIWNCNLFSIIPCSDSNSWAKKNVHFCKKKKVVQWSVSVHVYATKQSVHCLFLEQWLY